MTDIALVHKRSISFILMLFDWFSFDFCINLSVSLRLEDRLVQRCSTTVKRLHKVAKALEPTEREREREKGSRN